jgi:hypothetical protein
VPVYCQPIGDGYYQCDELANRFVRDALHHPNLDNVVTDLASIICAEAKSKPKDYQVFGPGYRSTSGEAPVPGDLIVLSGNLGHQTAAHVAVVTSVTSTQVRYVQQNFGPPTSSLGWNASRSWFTSPTVDCWVHAIASATSISPAGPSCGCFNGDGDYCGLAIVDHQSWYGCKASVVGGPLSTGELYSCSAGAFHPKRSCSECVSRSYTSAHGYCAVGDPCGHVSAGANGTYCGTATNNGFSAGTAGTLYTCGNGQVTHTVTCAQGCTPRGGATGHDACN